MNKLAALAAGLMLCVCAINSSYAAGLRFNLQPVSLCESGHPETCRPPLFDSAYLNLIFEQIGIEARVRSATEIDTLSFSRDINGDIDPDDALTKFSEEQTSLGVDDFTIYVGFTGEIEGPLPGLGFINSPGFAISRPFAIVENSLSLDIDAGLFDPIDTADLFELFPDRFFRYLGNGIFEEVFPPGPTDPLLRLVTAALAHQIGHVLGAGHDVFDGFLMSPVLSAASFVDETFIPEISQASEAIIRQSSLLTEVPVPPTLPLLAFGLIVVVIVGRRRT